MSMDDQSEIQRIIKECQQVFRTEANERLDIVMDTIEKWRQQRVSENELVRVIHQHVHALKGIALTLYFDAFHEFCEEILSSIQRHQQSTLAPRHIDDLEQLVDLTQQLMTKL